MKDEIKQILDIHNQINQLTANLQSNKENLKKKKDKLSTMRTEQDFDKSELKMLEIEAEKLWKNLTNYMLYAWKNHKLNVIINSKLLNLKDIRYLNLKDVEEYLAKIQNELILNRDKLLIEVINYILLIFLS